jgi:two-component system, chemotaxis family, CheB/CheR fusion protein
MKSTSTGRKKSKASKAAPSPKKASTAVALVENPATPISELESDSPEDTVSSILQPFSVVAIGASAGGLEALTALLSHLAKDNGMAYVVIQHLDPNHVSQSPEVLRRVTTLPIVEVKNGTALRPDTIFVMPSNVVMTLTKGALRLVRRGIGVSLPIDAFFRSLAAHHQSRAVGIVLSGNGVDGTKGLEAIKGEGGLTFAQDEGSAKFFGMPGSAIAAGVVDFVHTPKQMANQLKHIAHHPGARNATTTEAKDTSEEKLDWDKIFQGKPGDLATVFSLLRARTGVDFSLYKHTTLRRRIARRMVLHKVKGLPAYIDLLQTNALEIGALFDDLLINVTTFFRDPKVFQALKQKIFPKIVRAHPAEAALRIWVCGCATGEEAYSMAMTIVELFEATRSHRPVQIFATDISEASIEKAREGMYPESITQDVSPERLRRFFVKVDGRYQVHKSIRDMCVFARQNVVVDPPFSSMDLISCRNVMIYLGTILQRKIIPMFHYALRPNGFLLLGNSETIGASSELFTLVNKKSKIYSKKTGVFRSSFDILRPSQLRGRETPPAQEPLVTELRMPDLQQQADKILLRDFAPGAVVINTQMEVLHFRGRTGDYLEHAPGAASLNLLKMARESLVIDLRAAVIKSIKQNVTVRQRSIQAQSNGSRREITIEVVPFRMPPATERFFLVLFKETPAGELREHQEETASHPLKPAQEKRVVQRLRQELTATKDSLQSIIEEQEATNEEVKAANEEIQSSNEELQSTNEELETAKEELQSTNEELTTLNEELQNRNNELTTVNNDLTNLLSSVNMAILILGNDLAIRRFTPMAERLFNLIPSDLGRRLSDMNRSLLVPDLEKCIKDVIDNLSILEREVQDRAGRWYSLRIRPYRTRENRIDGAVILLVDIDDLKRALDTVVSTVHQPLLVLGTDFRVKQSNESFLKTFGLSAEEVENKKIYDIGHGKWDLPKLHTLMEAILPESKQVNDYELDLPGAGGNLRRVKLQARLFLEESRGMRLTLLAFELKS